MGPATKGLGKEKKGKEAQEKKAKEKREREGGGEERKGKEGGGENNHEIGAVIYTLTCLVLHRRRLTSWHPHGGLDVARKPR